MSNEREVQQRVFGALDIITKPVQIAADVVVGVLLLLAAILALLCYPFYLLFTGGLAAVSGDAVLTWLIVLFTVILFFKAPFYTVLGSIGVGVSWALWIGYAHRHMPHGDSTGLTEKAWCQRLGAGEIGLGHLAVMMICFLCLGYLLFVCLPHQQRERERERAAERGWGCLCGISYRIEDPELAEEVRKVKPLPLPD